MCRSRGSFVGSGAVGMQYAGYALLVGLSACTFSAERPGDVNGGGGGGGTTPHTGVGGTGVKIDAGDNVGDAYTGPCRNLECRPSNTCTRGSCTAQPCSGGGKTTVSGTVYDPAGKVPLYNVVVYVPNAALDPVPEGASCDRCGATLSGKPIASAITDESGHFSLENVPTGADVPLVIQVGKWRRELTVLDGRELRRTRRCPTRTRRGFRVTRKAGAHPQDGAHHRQRRRAGVPASQDRARRRGVHAGERHRPRQPVRGRGRRCQRKYTSTLNGGAAICRRRTVVERYEVANLMGYDMLLHSCEGTENPTNKSMAARQAFQDYTSAGGRAFLSHWHNYWVRHGPAPFPDGLPPSRPPG